MTDKELIKQEIERRIELLEPLECEYNKGSIDAYKGILQFINSFSEEPKKQPKFKVGDIIKGPHNNIFEIKEVLENQYVLHSKNGDELNSITIVDRSSCVVEEPASEDLKKEISKWRNHYISVLDNNLRIDLRDIEVTANYFAEWQRKKDQETIELAEDHAMLAGMNKMKEEMMKDAVETIIVNDWQYGKDPDHAIIPAIHQRIEGFNVGDKVKLIIIKEE